MAITDWNKLHGNAFARAQVLVTGGAGFIGSHLCEALAILGASVIVLDDLSGGERENLEPAIAAGGGGADGNRIEIVEGSILDQSTLQRCIEGCRFVFHQAALPSVPRSIEHPVLFHEVNVTGTLRVLEAAREAGVERVMFAASSSAYGDTPTLPKIETMAPLPKSPYAANKLAGEHMMRAYASSYDVDAVSLRYFNIFGPRQNANSAYAGVIAAFAKALLNERQPVIFGDGEQSRDFTFVDNAVQANLLGALSRKRLVGEVVNVGCGIRVTVTELARQMAAALRRAHLKPDYQPPRGGDVLHSLADLQRAKTLLGYEPIVDFDAGLQATVAWYEQARPWDDDTAVTAATSTHQSSRA